MSEERGARERAMECLMGLLSDPDPKVQIAAARAILAAPEDDAEQQAQADLKALQRGVAERFK